MTPSPAPAPRRPVFRDGLWHADLCILGAGPGGLSVAAGAVQMGSSVILIEKAAMGGDCLNTGCIPSKALIAAAAAWQASRVGTRFGLPPGDPGIDFAAVMQHVHNRIAAVAPHDSVERFEAMGVTVLRGAARFLDARRVAAGDATIHARRFVIATGSRPRLPAIPGLADSPYLTNESIFTLTECPRHLVILGGGAIGMELAQAFRRLGAAVTVLERDRILGRADTNAAALIRETLTTEGIVIRESVAVNAVQKVEAGISLTLEHPQSGQETLLASHLLVATGRIPDVEGLGLAAAGIAADSNGIRVDHRLRTSNSRVFALGDVTGGPYLTHRAGDQAGTVIRNALLALPASAPDLPVPEVIFTSPELAQLGLDETTARARHGDIRVLTAQFANNDRAITCHEDAGWIRVITTPRGRILGVTLVGPQAGELIAPWALAMRQNLPIRALAGLVLPYPTLGEISKRAAGQFYAPTLFGRGMQRLVGLIQRFVP